MIDNFNVTVLLDSVSRDKIKTNLSAQLGDNVKIITRLDELNSSGNFSNRVIVLEGVLLQERGLSDLRLYKNLLDLEYYFISSSNEQLFIMRDLATSCYKADIRMLNLNDIQNAIYHSSDSELQVEENNAITAFAHNVLNNQSSYDEDLIRLADAYLSVSKLLHTSYLDYKKLEHSFRKKDSENVFLNKLNRNLTDRYENVFSEAMKLNKVLEQYEIIYTKDICEKIDLHGYTNTPNVIYLKTYEELIHYSSFIQTLFDVFRLQKQNSVKVLQLFDSSGSRQVQVLPDYYHIIRNKYKVSDVVANDFLAKSGDYSKILDIILNIKTLDVLILVDRKDTSDLVLSGNFIQLNVCRNKNHLADFELLNGSTIVNAKEDSDFELLCWDDYKDLPQDNKDRFLFLSSRPVIQKIFKLYQMFSEKI